MEFETEEIAARHEFVLGGMVEDAVVAIETILLVLDALFFAEIVDGCSEDGFFLFNSL